MFIRFVGGLDGMSLEELHGHDSFLTKLQLLKRIGWIPSGPSRRDVKADQVTCITFLPVTQHNYEGLEVLSLARSL